MMKDDFIAEQYSQYHQIRRHVNAFSWQIPSLAILAVIFFVGLKTENIDLWLKNPLFPAASFLLLGFFLLVLLTNHIRNITFLRNFEENLADMEKEYGVEKKVYHHQCSSEWNWWQRLPSSTLLGIFIFVFMLIALFLGIAFLLKHFSISLISVAPSAAGASPAGTQIKTITTHIISNTSWTDISSALLAPIIAIIATYVAWQQWKINRHRLNLEKYDRRLRTYEEVKKILSIIFRDAKASREDILKFRTSVSEADFLFGPEIPQYMDEIFKHGLSLLSWNNKCLDATQVKPEGYDHDKVVNGIEKELEWLNGQFEPAREKFKKYLDISK